MAVKISEVFTPRSSKVNYKLYVPRLQLETELARSIEGSLHSILYGESGNGKSWLYKKVFEQYGIHFKVANCANASRLGSIAKAICSAVMPNGGIAVDQRNPCISDLIGQSPHPHENHQRSEYEDPLYVALSKYRHDVARGDAVIVLENLEAIFDDPPLMGELANILLLLDDHMYGDLKIKFLLVGVPNGILEYFAKTKNIESVANRLHELRKVGSLTTPMVKTLVHTGLNEQLKYNLSSTVIDEISTHVSHVTLGVAQRVQEYCERLSYHLEDARKVYSPSILLQADFDWLTMGLRQAYTVVESHLNSKQTTIARRNQVIYCIGLLSGHQLYSAAIVDLLRAEFPATAKETDMGVANILSDLSASDMPLLRKNPKTKDYRIVDPRYAMCIRAMLYKNPGTYSVEKKNFRI